MTSASAGCSGTGWVETKKSRWTGLKQINTTPTGARKEEGRNEKIPLDGIETLPAVVNARGIGQGRNEKIPLDGIETK